MEQERSGEVWISMKSRGRSVDVKMIIWSCDPQSQMDASIEATRVQFRALNVAFHHICNNTFIYINILITLAVMKEALKSRNGSSVSQPGTILVPVRTFI